MPSKCETSFRVSVSETCPTQQHFKQGKCRCFTGRERKGTLPHKGLSELEDDRGAWQSLFCAERPFSKPRDSGRAVGGPRTRPSSSVLRLLHTEPTLAPTSTLLNDPYLILCFFD